MILPFYLPNLIKVSILLSLILFGFDSIPITKTMRVHPVTTKRNITTLYSIDSQTPATTSGTFMGGGAQKKLRRLPHIFSKVLELPFRSDADVTIEERSDCFRFVAQTDDAFSDGVRVHAVQIHPGVTKIVVRGGSGGDRVELLLDELVVDAWRFRLPASARPELASVVSANRELVVTVPKDGREIGDGGEGWGGLGRLVLVQ